MGGQFSTINRYVTKCIICHKNIVIGEINPHHEQNYDKQNTSEMAFHQRYQKFTADQKKTRYMRS